MDTCQHMKVHGRIALAAKEVVTHLLIISFNTTLLVAGAPYRPQSYYIYYFLNITFVLEGVSLRVSARWKRIPHSREGKLRPEMLPRLLRGVAAEEHCNDGLQVFVAFTFVWKIFILNELWPKFGGGDHPCQLSRCLFCIKRWE